VSGRHWPGPELQYFASAVDNRSFGTGNKQIHNVTGWLSLVVREGDSFFRWSADQEWQPERPAQA